MNDLRLRPKGDYIVEANWTKLYVLTEHWQSDITFYRDELRFLSSLLDKYFMWLIDDENINATKGIASKLLEAEKRREELDRKIIKHLHHLEGLVENPFSHDAQVFREEHAKLEDDLSNFAKDFRMVKKEVFQLTEHVIQSEKIKHLLGS